MQNVARLRIDGERIGLPARRSRPYLVGLLVMLGMLGTFLGMTVTLNGAVMALESTTDLQTIRATLAAPVKGLGLAFGTSVAGVAASAMLGLISSLCRRERLQAGLLLDMQIAGPLRRFSLAQERQGRPGARCRRRAKRCRRGRQTAGADDADGSPPAPARTNTCSPGRNSSCRDRNGLQRAGAIGRNIAARQPRRQRPPRRRADCPGHCTSAMEAVAHDTLVLHEKVAATLEKQLDGLATRFDGTVRHVEQGWTAALEQQVQHQDATVTRLREALDAHAQGVEQRSTALLAGVGEAACSPTGRTRRTRRAAHGAAGDGGRNDGAILQREWRAAGAETLAQQQQICRTLEDTAARWRSMPKPTPRTIDERSRA